MSRVVVWLSHRGNGGRSANESSGIAVTDNTAAAPQSAERVASAVEQVEDSADRRTVLAADRTIFAARRTYAAWVRTASRQAWEPRPLLARL